MHTATVRRPGVRRRAGNDASLTPRLAALLSIVTTLFLVVFTAGYAEVNLFITAARVIVTTWHVVTSPWTYVLAAFAFGVVKILRGSRG